MLDTVPGRTVPAESLAALPRLGVGLTYQGALRDFVLERPESYDFLEIIPDTFWVDRGTDAAPRFQESLDAPGFLDRLRAMDKALICHSIGMSIGSAELFDPVYVDQVVSWQGRFGFPWQSDHLSFNRLEEHGTGQTIDVGFTMPVPYDEEVLEMLASRVEYVQSRTPVPFLLENNVYYFSIPGQDMTEPEFLNRLSARTGCGLLLDLHNVHVNATNHGFDPWADFLGQVDLTRVVEIHIAGGLTVDGVYLDAHSGPSPEPVWKLLREVVPQAPNLKAVVFEIFGSYFNDLGADRLVEELRQARAIFARVA